MPNSGKQAKEKGSTDFKANFSGLRSDNKLRRSGARWCPVPKPMNVDMVHFTR